MASVADFLSALEVLRVIEHPTAQQILAQKDDRVGVLLNRILHRLSDESIEHALDCFEGAAEAAASQSRTTKIEWITDKLDKPSSTMAEHAFIDKGIGYTLCKNKLTRAVTDAQDPQLCSVLNDLLSNLVLADVMFKSDVDEISLVQEPAGNVGHAIRAVKQQYVDATRPPAVGGTDTSTIKPITVAAARFALPPTCTPIADASMTPTKQVISDPPSSNTATTISDPPSSNTATTISDPPPSNTATTISKPTKKRASLDDATPLMMHVKRQQRDAAPSLADAWGRDSYITILRSLLNKDIFSMPPGMRRVVQTTLEVAFRVEQSAERDVVASRTDNKTLTMSVTVDDTYHLMDYNPAFIPDEYQLTRLDVISFLKRPPPCPHSHRPHPDVSAFSKPEHMRRLISATIAVKRFTFNWSFLDNPKADTFETELRAWVSSLSPDMMTNILKNLHADDQELLNDADRKAFLVGWVLPDGEGLPIAHPDPVDFEWVDKDGKLQWFDPGAPAPTVHPVTVTLVKALANAMPNPDSRKMFDAALCVLGRYRAPQGAQQAWCDFGPKETDSSFLQRYKTVLLHESDDTTRPKWLRGLLTTARTLLTAPPLPK
jgi:hypothetical protein